MSERTVLVVAHTGRGDSLEAARSVLGLLADSDVVPVLTERERADLDAGGAALDGVRMLGDDVAVHELELVVVLGGDGTILRAAELVRGTGVPVLGVNLGHVGFRVLRGTEVVHRDWALNEATVEKASRERMLEVVVEIDERPLSSFGCDGVVVSTPTGSTAYAFSAGGPVVWPGLRAMLFVPLSAHALFARPLVVPPESTVAVEVLRRTDGTGVLWCDGRRTVDLEPGARVEVRSSAVPVRLARLHRGRFTDRLVDKFELPVTGWRGPAGS